MFTEAIENFKRAFIASNGKDDAFYGNRLNYFIIPTSKEGKYKVAISKGFYGFSPTKTTRATCSLDEVLSFIEASEANKLPVGALPKGW